MLVDFNSLAPIEKIQWHFLPNPEDGWIPGEIYRCQDALCILQKQPVCVSQDDLIAVEWSASVFRKRRQASGRFKKPLDAYEQVLSVSIEREDLRALAEASGTDLRELQEEYGTKGYFSSCRCKVYSAEEYEDLGPCENFIRLEDARQFLLEAVCDTLDIVAKPEQMELQSCHCAMKLL